MTGDAGNNPTRTTRHHTRDHAGDICIILSGELDMSAVPALADLLAAEVARANLSAVVADLQGVTFVDSIAISALLSAHHAATTVGRGFTITNVRGHVRRVLGATGVLATLSTDEAT